MLNRFVRRAAGAAMLSALCSAGQAATLGGLLPNSFYTTYGDANVYALAVLAHYYDAKVLSVGTGPSNPYYVTSTPGAIADLVVVATGTDGNPATTNNGRINDAYPTPSGQSGSVYFSTSSVANPGTSAPNTNPTTQNPDAWNASLGSLKNFLAGDQMVFFFNNNQTKSGEKLPGGGTASAVDESLAAWGRAWITDAKGNVVKDKFGSSYFFLTGNGGAYGNNGVDFGDVTVFQDSTTTAPKVGDNGAGGTDYILAGGKLCLDANFLPTACAGAAYTIDNNLGANQAAYAVVLPELNALMTSLFTANPADLGNYTLHVDVRLGCEAKDGNGTGTDSAANPDTTDYCTARKLNNGYEQIFIGSAVFGTPVPEPGTLALLALAFGGLGVARLRAGRRA